MKMEQATLFFVMVLLTLVPDQYGKPIHQKGRYFYMPDSEGKMNLAILDKNELLPRATAENDVHFLLFSRRNPSDAELLKVGDDAVLAQSSFNCSLPTKILSHGYGGAGDDWFNTQARNAYLKKGDFNVISVDWKTLAATPWYFNAAYNTEVVGDYTAKLITFLKSHGASSASFHVIGFSLGSHVAGIAGRKVKIGRVTGLDPAYPLFEFSSPEKRLDVSDAVFVDVVHTCGGNLLTGGLAFKDPIGDVDFYPNGGYGQPGCRSKRGYISDMLGGCSHSRAPRLFVESINNENSFRAWPCDSWQNFQNNECWNCGDNCTNLGESVSKRARGRYYLSTSSETPYSLD